jgi:hypothetical protein
VTTTGVGLWVIDLSNVAVVPGTGGRDADWDRVELLVSLLRLEASAQVFGVADRSLYYGRLDERGRTALRAWQSRGRALLEPWADPAICERAGQHDGVHIVTNDNFRGLRRMFPFLQGFDRIWGFRLDERPSVFRRALAELGDAEISRAEEDEERTPKRLRTATGMRLLAREWQCVNQVCTWSDFSAIEELPLNRDGTAACPSCEKPLQDAGAASSTRAIKIGVLDEVVERAPVPLGASVTLGRREGRFRIDLRGMAPTGEAQRVSREHLSVFNMNSRILVEDLGSTNGTVIEREDGGRFVLAPGRKLILTENERALLAPSVWIGVSGRQYPRGRVDSVDSGLPEPQPTRLAKDRDVL